MGRLSTIKVQLELELSATIADTNVIKHLGINLGIQIEIVSPLGRINP